MHACLVQLFVTVWTVAFLAPLSMGFFRQEYWCWLPFPPSEDLLNFGIKHTLPVSPALQVDSLPAEPLGKSIGQILGGKHFSAQAMTNRSINFLND